MIDNRVQIHMDHDVRSDAKDNDVKRVFEERCDNVATKEGSDSSYIKHKNNKRDLIDESVMEYNARAASVAVMVGPDTRMRKHLDLWQSS